MRQLFILCVALVFSYNTIAQIQRCRFDELRKKRVQEHPEYYLNSAEDEQKLQNWISTHERKRQKVTIPVVVHVIYNASNENISDQQVQSQIDILNKDYNKLNSDTLLPSHPFYALSGKLDIQFALASFDPKGNTTNGITRTKTSKVSWGEDDINYDNMKFTSTGGVENWNPKKYLNIYVVRYADSVGLLGYAYPPQDLANYPETDGVVIDFRTFGNIGTSGIEGYDAYDLGRTTTHEVGHWLDLVHIWGDKALEIDKACGDDLVADTPPAESDNSGTPSFPLRPSNKCGSNQYGEMYMNYMDYVHDNAMHMFTVGQAQRMNAAIHLYRSDLLTPSSDVLVSSLKITAPNNNYTIFAPNKELQLGLTVSPINASNKMVRWSISPDSIATIDQTGKITAIKDGLVNVTASALDGSFVNDIKTILISGFSKNNSDILVSSINITTPNNNFSLVAPNTELQLGITISPQNAKNKAILWSISPDSIATIDQLGRVHPIKDGFAIVSAFATDGSLISDSKNVSFSGFSELGLYSLNQTNQVLYPNPVSDKLYISYNSDESVQLIIRDVIGNIQIEQLLSGSYNQEIDVSFLAKGYYTVSLKSNNSERFHSFTKQ